MKFGSPVSASTSAAGVKITGGTGAGIGVGEIAGCAGSFVAGRLSPRAMKNSVKAVAERAEGYTK
jgi:hypothetical protein